MFCITLAEKSLDKAYAKIKIFQDKTNLFELRIDALEKISQEELENFLKKVGEKIKLIFTLRSYKEGGFRKITQDVQKNWILWAIKKPFYLVDVEWMLFKKYDNKIKEYFSEYDKILVSYHNFKKKPETKYLRKLLHEMKEKGIKKTKIVCLVKNEKEAEELLDLIEFGKNLGLEVISFGMGEKGKISRVVCLLKGSPFTYVCSDKNEAVAPGQLDYFSAKKLLENLLKAR